MAPKKEILLQVFAWQMSFSQKACLQSQSIRSRIKEKISRKEQDWSFLTWKAICILKRQQHQEQQPQQQMTNRPIRQDSEIKGGDFVAVAVAGPWFVSTLFFNSSVELIQLNRIERQF